LTKDGDKDAAIRKIIYRSKNHMPKIKEDLELIERLLEAYSKA
jgi:hypothetical protein